jgi:membrane protease YdiL (CAAX protease family)
MNSRTATSARVPLVAMAAAFVVATLLLLDVVGGLAYTAIVAALALAGVAVATAVARMGARPAWLRLRVDWLDLLVVLVLYGLVVACFRLAFTVFTQDNVLGLFLSFAAGLLVGVIGPVAYTRWRGRQLASLGLRVGDWRATATLAVVFAAVQFSITLARVESPAPDVWLPLLASALVVGLFESVFFRGFIQNRMEAAFGLVPGVAIAAGLYGLYHVGYGMGLEEMAFLVGLGAVYGVAFRSAGSVLVLWPLLTPAGSLFSQLQSGDVAMPLIAILGFADVIGLMAAAIWYARRHERRALAAGDHPRTPNVTAAAARVGTRRATG